MSTATNVLGAIPTNVGPLTTAFTAPTTCVDNRYTYIGASRNGTSKLKGVPTCSGPERPECIPSGSKIESIVSAKDRLVLPYHSPGLQCPSGWITAGTTVAGGLAAGVFTSNLFPGNGHNNDYPQHVPLAAKYAFILEPSETLVWCCPSNYNAGIGGGCVSSVGPASSYSFTAICELVETFALDDPMATAGFPGLTSYNGTTWMPPLESYVPDKTQNYFTTFEPLPTEPLNDTQIYIANVENMVALIHKKDDKKSDASATKGFSAYSVWHCIFPAHCCCYRNCISGHLRSLNAVADMASSPVPISQHI